MILLTKELNDILDTEGFPELTIRRSDDGFLNLVGRKCGKPILSFNTMSISKKLTAAERKILRDDYIIPVITTYKKELITLIKELKDSTTKDSIEKLVADVKKDGFKISEYSSYDYTKQKNDLVSITISEKITLVNKSYITVTYKMSNKKWNIDISKEDQEVIAGYESELIKTVGDLSYCETKVNEYKILLDEMQLKTARLAKAQKDMIEKCSL